MTTVIAQNHGCTGPYCGRPREPGSAYCEMHQELAGDHEIVAEIVCPHCHERGYVRRVEVRAKRGISGGKATAALLTGGVSLFGTGLSRKEAIAEMWCINCRTGWTVS